MLRLLENFFAAIGLLALMFGGALILLSLEPSPAQHCDIRITNASGTSCYLVKEYRK